MKISIVTVVFNRKNEFEETAKSVLEQNYSDLEYIVIDGGSTDGTVDVIKKYSDNIDYWHTKPDNGIFDGMNIALEHVKGEYTLFLNAGDKFYDNTIVKSIFEGKRMTHNIIYGDRFIRTNLGLKFEKANPVYKKKNFTKKQLVFFGQGICHQSIFTKTNLLKEVKFDTSLPYGADYDTTMKIFNNYDGEFFYVNKAISIFDARDTGFSHNNLFNVLSERANMFNYKKGIYFYYYITLHYLIDRIKKVIKNYFPQITKKHRQKKYVKFDS